MQMEGRALITRVVLENYKSIAFCDIELGPLSILVGPNGAGKSNFLDGLRFLSEAMKLPVDKVFDRRGGFGNVIRRADPASTHVGFRIDFITADGTTGHYSVRLRKHEKEGYINEKEHCVVGVGSDNSYLLIEGVASACSPRDRRSLHLPIIMAKDPKFRGVFDLIDGFRFYNPNVEKLIQGTADAAPNRVLSDDGSNLANVVNYLHQAHLVRTVLEPDASSVLDRIVQYLQTVNPQIAAINTEAFGGSRHLRFLQKGGADEFYPRQMSDGTLRSLAVLVALFQPSPLIPVSLVGLEEPETALHPAAAGVLFDAMREASASVQVLVTTHSADLLDKKEIDTDAILSVELVDGTTRIGHLDQTGRQALKQQLYTPGELMRMNYLRPEPSQIPDDSKIESKLFEGQIPA
jgi:predicted ATPase